MALHSCRQSLAARAPVRVTNVGERFTEQHHAKACDVETIIRTYARTGVITHMNNLPGRYEDLPDQIDYQEALHIVAKSHDAFASLPSAARERYSNNPRAFLDALANPNERDFLTAHGVFNSRQATVLPDGASIVEEVKPA